MFGIFYSLLVGIGILKDEIDNESFKLEKRYEAAQNGKDTYYDAKANLYYLNNGVETSCYKTTSDGHEVLRSIKDHDILKDYTQEGLIQMDIDFDKKKKAAKENAIKNNKKYYQVKGIFFPTYCRKKINGHSYETDFGGQLDRRCKVRYLADGDVAYILDEKDKWTSKCYITYYEVNKFYCKRIKTELITEDEYMELGGWMGIRNPNN